MRAALFAILLAVAATFVVIGVASWSTGAAWIVAGVELALLSWAVLSGPSSGRGGVRRALVALLAEPPASSDGDAT